jgi:hypothetical protein
MRGVPNDALSTYFKVGVIRVEAEWEPGGLRPLPGYFVSSVPAAPLLEDTTEEGHLSQRVERKIRLFAET